MAEDTLINFGSALKSLGDGRYGGYAVLFTSPDDPDLSKEYFTKETDFFFDEGKGMAPVLYAHGKDPVMKKRKLGKATLEVKDAGIWFETQLEIRDEYEKKVIELIEAGKAGLSSGSMPHLVEKTKVNGAKHIKSWPIGEVSITPKPCEWRTSVQSLKDFNIDGEEAEETPVVKPDAIKGIFEQELAEQSPSVWQLHDILRSVCRDIADAVRTSDISGVTIDVSAKVSEAVTEYAARLTPLIVAQINDHVESGNQEFYLRSLSVPAESVSDSTLDAHSQTVVTAVAEYAQVGASLNADVKAWHERVQEKLEFRATKDGRTISAATKQKIATIRDHIPTVVESLQAMDGHLGDLLDKAEPKKSVPFPFQLEIERHKNWQAQNR